MDMELTAQSGAPPHHWAAAPPPARIASARAFIVFCCCSYCVNIAELYCSGEEDGQGSKEKEESVNLFCPVG